MGEYIDNIHNQYNKCSVFTSIIILNYILVKLNTFINNNTYKKKHKNKKKKKIGDLAYPSRLF